MFEISANLQILIYQNLSILLGKGYSTQILKSAPPEWEVRRFEFPRFSGGKERINAFAPSSPSNNKPTSKRY